MRYRPSTFHEKSDAPRQMGRNLPVPLAHQSAIDPLARAGLRKRLFLDEVIFLISDAPSRPHSPFFSGKRATTNRSLALGSKKVGRKGNEALMTLPGNWLNASLAKVELKL